VNRSGTQWPIVAFCGKGGGEKHERELEHCCKLVEGGKNRERKKGPNPIKCKCPKRRCFGSTTERPVKRSILTQGHSTEGMTRTKGPNKVNTMENHTEGGGQKKKKTSPSY